MDKIPEYRIETSTSSLKKDITKIQLEKDETLISYDVASLYTNVPVNEAIEMASIKLFQNTDKVPVDIQTFIKLAHLACTNIIIQTPNGYIKQIDGLGMGIPCAPQLANIWMASFDKKLRVTAKYMQAI